MKIPNGISTVFDHKKWAFSYVIVILSFWNLESADIILVLVALIPSVIGANAFDKKIEEIRERNAK